MSVANLHIRDVPDDVVKRLKKRAAREGTSLNAQAVLALRAAAGRRPVEEVLDDLEQLAREINLPPDAPMPEELIRHDRDTR